MTVLVQYKINPPSSLGWRRVHLLSIFQGYLLAPQCTCIPQPLAHLCYDVTRKVSQSSRHGSKRKKNRKETKTNNKAPTIILNYYIIHRRTMRYEFPHQHSNFQNIGTMALKLVKFAEHPVSEDHRDAWHTHMDNTEDDCLQICIILKGKHLKSRRCID